MIALPQADFSEHLRRGRRVRESSRTGDGKQKIMQIPGLLDAANNNDIGSLRQFGPLEFRLPKEETAKSVW